MAGKLLTKLECKCVSKMDDDGAFENCGAWTGSSKVASVMACTSADVSLSCACNADSSLACRSWSSRRRTSASPSPSASDLSISLIVLNCRAST